MKRPYIIITEDTPKEKVIPTLERLGGANKFIYSQYAIDIGDVWYIDEEDWNIRVWPSFVDFKKHEDIQNYYQLDSKTLEPIEENKGEKSLIKNPPKKLYLNVGGINMEAEFNELSQVTWSENEINKDDIPYVLESEIDKLKNRVKELEECLSGLVDYDKKYPSGKIYRYSDANKMCAELDKVIEQAKQLLNKS